jgi:hypothetical protein
VSKTDQAPKIAPVTVGDLITELCRWPDHAAVSFRYPGTNAELGFSRIVGPTKGIVEIELQAAAEEPVTVAPV